MTSWFSLYFFRPAIQVSRNAREAAPGDQRRQEKEWQALRLRAEVEGG